MHKGKEGWRWRDVAGMKTQQLRRQLHTHTTKAKTNRQSRRSPTLQRETLYEKTHAGKKRKQHTHKQTNKLTNWQTNEWKQGRRRRKRRTAGRKTSQRFYCSDDIFFGERTMLTQTSFGLLDLFWKSENILVESPIYQSPITLISFMIIHSLSFFHLSHQLVNRFYCLQSIWDWLTKLEEDLMSLVYNL